MAFRAPVLFEITLSHANLITCKRDKVVVSTDVQSSAPYWALANSGVFI